MDTPRPIADVQVVLDRNVGRGERSVAAVRVVAAVLALLQMLWVDTGAVANFELRPWLVIFGLGSGIGYSLWTLRRQVVVTHRVLWLSALVDTLVVSAALFPTMLWPRELYPGQLHLPSVGFFALAAALCGLRLERRLVWASIASNGAMAGLLVALDLHLNGVARDLVPSDLFIWIALFIAASALGDAITVRTRALLSEATLAVTQRERARLALGVYVSEMVADGVFAEGSMKLGGSRAEVVVLFSDLRGFTAYSGGLSPERLVTEINAYLDRMVEVIRREGGVVDKYIGDAIMVVFGLPHAKPDDATRAVRCAARMQEVLLEHNEEREALGQPALKQGIGVHKGSAVAGNIGSKDRLQYTVMGSTVNLASRIESATKTEGVDVLISDAVVEAVDLGDPQLPPLQPHGSLSLRGHEAEVQVWKLA